MPAPGPGKDFRGKEARENPCAKRLYGALCLHRLPPANAKTDKQHSNTDEQHGDPSPEEGAGLKAGNSVLQRPDGRGVSFFLRASVLRQLRAEPVDHGPPVRRFVLRSAIWTGKAW